MPLITRAKLARVAPHALAHVAAAIADHADVVLPRYGLATRARLTDFLAHVLVESAYLSRLSEDLDYTAARLCAVWPSRFPTLAAAAPYAHDPRKLADCVYGGRMGNTGADDGWLNRGQGLLETTGHDNIAALALQMRVGFEAARASLTSDAGMLEAAAATYVRLGAPAYADRGDIVGSTRRVNGGLNGLAERRAALALCQKVWPRVPMPDPAPAPSPPKVAASAPHAAPTLARAPAAPAIPPQTKETTAVPTRMPAFLAFFAAVFGFGQAQAAVPGLPPAGVLSLVATLLLGLAVAMVVGRTPRRFHLRSVFGLAMILLAAGAASAHAATVDLGPAVQAGVDDFLRPVLLAVASTVTGLLALPLKRYLGEQASLILLGRVNDLLDKAIAFGAAKADAAVETDAAALRVEVSNPIVGYAADYALDHAPELARRAAGAVGPKLATLIKEKVVSRLAAHPDFLVLQAKAAARAPGAPLQLAGAAA